MSILLLVGLVTLFHGEAHAKERSLASMIADLSQGNPGAMTVLLKWTETTLANQKDRASLTALMNLLLLEEIHVTGPAIWGLYKDVCQETLTCLEDVAALALSGAITQEELHYAIENRGKGLDLSLHRVQRERRRERRQDLEF